MEGEALRQGKERVRSNLIGPLEALGMQRKRGVSVADHAAWVDKLVGRLAYMRADNLLVLAEVCERYAGGKAKSQWPEMISICNWARDLQDMPEGEQRLVKSWLQSAAGRRALADGYAVELRSDLIKWHRPPNEYQLRAIKERAGENRRRAVSVVQRQERGVASPSELEWLASYQAALERVTAIINAGKEVAA